MAPALNFLFDRAALAAVTIPIRLYRAEADEIVPAPFNAEHIRRALPREPEYQVLERASHYAFIAPCSPALAQGVPEICRDPPGVDRAAIHRRLNVEIAKFFARTLGRP
jgi:predicted dienelactone hydrolase